ncbi:acyltransferase family protein [Saccharomonospora saliphila]|uniref:acyltransferase family protein n=1 Tax=Saccharomonospora saliphila TaxID=369829 RepID=UPI00037087A4|nr:acyltransferase family protein [Saccharomonospora saliphila]
MTTTLNTSASGATGSSTDPSAPEPPGRATTAGHRPEIEGLRAVAVLLVAVYHIWFGRVSGGVDVFLLLTGFLITGSLLRMTESAGRVRFAAFFSRLFKRLFPPVGVVLVGVLGATWLWLPEPRWRGTIAEAVASALYVENWSLATSAVDYLDRTELPSPVQHFWSLSIQGQFYVVWAVLIAVTVAVARRAGAGTRTAGLVACGAVFAGSLTYSVLLTDADQAWAYFDLGARLWEFALGGILALTLPLIRLPRPMRVALGWLGLAALIACGALFDVSTMFPGYVALWPVGAAALVLLAGTTGSPVAADRLLTWRPLTQLGAISYALYLWHWPVLVVYLAQTERSVATLPGGLAVLAVSVGLAVLTRTLLEKPVNAFTRPRTHPGWAMAVVAAFLAPVLVVTTLWTARLDDRQVVTVTEENASDYPGARVLTSPELAASLPSAPVVPAPADAREDVPDTYDVGCHASLEQTEARVCSHGPAEAEHSIAVVGASRSAHWYPALREIADERGWRVHNITKSSCQFSTDTPHTVDGAVYTQCLRWRENLMTELARLRPDVVLTSSTRATADGERAFDGFVERWRQLADLGIDVLGVRDLPRVEGDGASCVATRGADECLYPASYSHAPSDPARALTDVPETVSLTDLTRYVCPEGQCPAVVGNVLVYRDDAHLTTVYSRTLAPVLETAIVRATGW